MSTPLERGDDQPPICDYEGSHYQEDFWDQGGREYEDQVEAIALRRLLPAGGELLLEVGAGAGRNTPRYEGYERIVLMDYSRSQLRQAQERLGRSGRYVYVAADIYRMPFVAGLFETATMIRVLHHMAEAPRALGEIRRVLQPEATFVLEFASKMNLKAILRYVSGRQDWSPFTREAVEFAELNYDFHPAAVRDWLQAADFRIRRQLTVSHFRLELLKRVIPTSILVALDSLFQLTGNWWQLTPSVFVRAEAGGDSARAAPGAFFQCPRCGEPLAETTSETLDSACGVRWGIGEGIYDFREPLKQ